MGLTIYAKEVGPFGTVTISMLCLIRLRIFKKTFPESALSWEFFIYISGEGFILPLHLSSICGCIDMFLHIITIYVLICMCIL